MQESLCARSDARRLQRRIEKRRASKARFCRFISHYSFGIRTDKNVVSVNDQTLDIFWLVFIIFFVLLMLLLWLFVLYSPSTLNSIAIKIVRVYFFTYNSRPASNCVEWESWKCEKVKSNFCFWFCARLFRVENLLISNRINSNNMIIWIEFRDFQTAKFSLLPQSCWSCWRAHLWIFFCFWFFNHPFFSYV